MLTGRLARWAIILTEFDITFTPQKAVKGQALADFLAAHPIPDDSPLACEFPDEEILHVEEQRSVWKMYFDGASSIRPAIRPNPPKIRAGAGLVFVSPEGGIIRHSFALTEPCTNNEAEYEALIAGLEVALEMGIQNLEVFGDSQLVISQVKGEFQTLKLELWEYRKKVMELVARIPQVCFNKIS